MTRTILICTMTALALTGLTVHAADPADRVFYGEHIVTMDPATPDAEAVAIRGDRIVYVGDRSGAAAFAGRDTRSVELGERALVPGLIDSHGHVAMAARLIDWVNASSPPVGPAQSIDDILKLLRERLAGEPPADGEWLLAYGYDDSLLAEQRHPTREDLDRVSADVPIYMLHVSGHLGTANSAALAAAGIDADTPDPEGGVFRRMPGSRVPNGVAEETANYVLALPRLMAQAEDPVVFREQMEKAVRYFAGFGITTIQDGAASMADVEMLRQFASEGAIGADIVTIPRALDSEPQAVAALHAEGRSAGRVSVGGVKFILDGSPQGRTAWTTEPYDELPDGAQHPYTAYPTVDPAKFKAEAKDYLLSGIPIYMHANGDAAIDLAMDAVEEAFAGRDIPDHRSVIIHAQLMRPDQVARAARLKMVPSFYSAHAFFWGDWHRSSFGDERAFGISPAASALELGMKFTIHNDAPVVPPHMMRLMWAAVNRETRSGVILGPDERLSPYDALYALTQGGAYQYFQEDLKGSLTVGKQADLTILGANPLEVPPETIVDIPVLETLSRGTTIFRAQ